MENPRSPRLLRNTTRPVYGAIRAFVGLSKAAEAKAVMKSEGLEPKLERGLRRSCFLPEIFGG